MVIRDQAALLAAIVTLALAGAALLRSARPRSLTLFALLSLDLALFSLAEFLHGLPGAQAWHDVWKRLAIGAGALLPAAALAFFLEFLGVKRRPARRARDLMLAGSVFGVVVAVSPLARSELAPLLVAGFVILGLTAVLSVVWRAMAAAQTRADRSRLTYVLVGAAVVGILAFLDFLPRLGFPYPLEGLGFLALTLYMFLLLQALLRRRLLDLHEFLGKIAVVTLLGLVLATIYGGLVSWVGGRPGLFFFNTLVASFVILSLFDPIRSKVEEWVVVGLFRERYELVRQLEALRDRVVNVIDPAGLGPVVLDGLAETRRVTHASLWLVSEDRPGYRLLAFRGPEPVPFLEAGTARALLRVAVDGRRAVLLENLDRRLAEIQVEYPPAKGDAAAPPMPPALSRELERIVNAREAMALMKAGICMPLLAGDRVAGFLAAWDERVQEAFASDEIAALIEVADRCAVVIDNSKLYHQMKERDRLAALGEMAAGLAHEIRNPLAAIKGATQYLDPRRLPGEDREFLEIIVDEVDRLNGVVTAFLDYSRPLKPSLAPADVGDILQRTFKLLAPQVPPAIAVSVEVAPELPQVLCDAEQLRQVFINLALNSFQAMPGGGRLDVTAGLARDEVASWREPRFRDARVEVRFRDTGPGIPPEARENVFVPFYTTKEKGTGLGLAISQRIVKAHHGSLAISGPPGGGAEFTVSLPSIPAEAQAVPPSGLDVEPSPGLPRPRPRRRRRRG
ncbi:MAG TPA: ATP-binding protein [Anaeromyxobacteraceae bacterium]|nr:ATP-binding protein [Anaeromyxobacteraceae bacterium]